MQICLISSNVPAISHMVSCCCGIFLYCSSQVWGGDIMSAFPRSAPPDHIEGAHPLLGGEIRFLLFWLAPPCPALHFSTTTCYYQSNYCRVCGLFLWTAARYNFLSLKSQLCWLSVWLVALKPDHQVEPTSVSA